MRTMPWNSARFGNAALSISVALAAVCFMGARGQCKPFRTEMRTDTLSTCAAGTCTGSLVIVYAVRACDSLGEQNCETIMQYDTVRYAAKPEYLPTSTFLGCLAAGPGISVACAVEIGVACGIPGINVATCAAGIAVCATYAAYFGSVDACCYTACVKNIASFQSNQIQSCRPN